MVASRSRHFRLLLVLAPAALAMLLASCDKVPLTAPTGSTITLTAHATFVPLNGTALLTVTVIEAAGTPVQNGTVVTFSTNIGTIDPPEARTHNGSATVTFRAGTVSGTATVRAVSGGSGSSSGGNGSGTQSSEIELKVGAAAASKVLLNASPGAVPAGGGTVTLTATVVDETGNRLAGVPVTFVSAAGTLLNGTVLTDANGEARTTLTTLTEARVTATAGGQSVDLTVSVSPAINVSISLASTGVGGQGPVAGQAATFTVTASSATGGAPLRDVTVNWGDGQVQSLGTPSGASISVSHVYSSPGTYTPTVIATDAAGQTTRASTTVTVVASARPLVTLNLSRNTVAPGEIFTASVAITQQNSNALVDSVDFDFGDGVVKRVNGLQTTHSYGSPGSYNITATVRFTNGTSSTSSAGIRVQ